MWAIDGEGDARRCYADDHGDDAEGEDAAVPGFLSPARGQGQLVERSGGVGGRGQRQPWFSSLQASERVGLAAHHVGEKTQERPAQSAAGLDAGHRPATTRRCAGDGGKRLDPTWSASPGGLGCLGADQTGHDLSCRCSRSQLWLPALLLPDGARIGSRIGGGSGDLMPVGGPAWPRCLLTVSGSEQAAACSPAGIALGMCFCSLPVFTSPVPDQAVPRQGS